MLAGIDFNPPYRIDSEEYEVVNWMTVNSVERNYSRFLDAGGDDLQVMAGMSNGYSKPQVGGCTTETEIYRGSHGLAFHEQQPQ